MKMRQYSTNRVINQHATATPKYNYVIPCHFLVYYLMQLFLYKIWYRAYQRYDRDNNYSDKN